MQTMTGVLEGAYQKEINGKPTTDYKMNGVYIKDWNPPKANKGDNVTIVYEEKQNGQYTNRTVKSLTVEGAAQAAPAQAAPKQTYAKKSYGGKYQEEDPKKQASIITQSVVKSEVVAAIVVEAMKTLGDKATVDEMISVADQVIGHITKKVIAQDYSKTEEFEATDDFVDDEIPFGE